MVYSRGAKTLRELNWILITFLKRGGWCLDSLLNSSLQGGLIKYGDYLYLQDERDRIFPKRYRVANTDTKGLIASMAIMRRVWKLEQTDSIHVRINRKVLT